MCKKWRDCVYEKCVWRNMEATLDVKKSVSSFYPSLARRGIKKVQVRSTICRVSLRDMAKGLPDMDEGEVTDAQSAPGTLLLMGARRQLCRGRC